MRGLFITFEGPDGSGKSTQAKKLKEYLEKQNCQVVMTREPGGTVISEKIREIILDVNHDKMDDVTEALLYAASRAQHISEVIHPALEQGKFVICDRFVDSSIAYQGYGRHLGESVELINEFATKGLDPDITFFLKLNPEIGKSRIKTFDRLEMEHMDYHKKVYEGYLALEKKYPQRIVGIDASGSIGEIQNKLIVEINRLIKEKR